VIGIASPVARASKRANQGNVPRDPSADTEQMVVGEVADDDVG